MDSMVIWKIGTTFLLLFLCCIMAMLINVNIGEKEQSTLFHVSKYATIATGGGFIISIIVLIWV